MQNAIIVLLAMPVLSKLRRKEEEVKKKTKLQKLLRRFAGSPTIKFGRTNILPSRGVDIVW